MFSIGLDLVMTVDFYGPRLKLERAEHHIRKLEAIFGQYVRDNVKRLRPERQQRLLKNGQIGSTPTFPKHTPTVLGDALHNLRVSLDHAYHIVCEAKGAKFNKYRRFPFGKDRQSLEGSMNGQKQEGITPSDKVIAAIIDDIQPYADGKLGLYGLHELDITDKHLTLIPTAREMRVGHLEMVDASGAKTGTTISGIKLDLGQNKDFEFFGTGDRPSLLGLPEGYSLVSRSKPEGSFKMVFGEGQPFQGQPIPETVRSLQKGTIEALDILAKAAE
jgi:hypothetical protein